MTPHHITRISAENFMRLSAVDIEPNGNVIYITGANGEGKSSILNAICAALNWRDAAGNIPEPIHKGEKKAVVTIDLGDMIVTRTWTSSGSQLKVESRDGARYPTPQAMLDKFFSSIGFDPLEFIRMQPKEQRQTLMDLLGIDFSQYDLERADLLQEKSTASAHISGLQQQLNEIPDVPEDVPDQEVSAGELIQQIREVQSIQTKYQRVIDERTSEERYLESTKKEIEDLEDALSDARHRLENTSAKIQNLNLHIGSIVVPEVTPLQDQLTNIEHTNKLVRQKQQKVAILERLQQAEKTVEDLSESIKDIDQDKRDALESARFPVKGLTFDESGVLFQGVPLKQASSAEQIRVSLAIGIAMNPALKFMIIRDGSLLDTKSRELVADMAAKHDMQVFIEAVDESGKMGFVIEDGMVRAPVEPISPVEPGQQVLA